MGQPLGPTGQPPAGPLLSDPETVDHVGAAGVTAAALAGRGGDAAGGDAGAELGAVLLRGLDPGRLLALHNQQTRELVGAGAAMPEAQAGAPRAVKRGPMGRHAVAGRHDVEALTLSFKRPRCHVGTCSARAAAFAHICGDTILVAETGEAAT